MAYLYFLFASLALATAGIGTWLLFLDRQDREASTRRDHDATLEKYRNNVASKQAATGTSAKFGRR